jgi:hypothetical protein
MVVKHKEYYYTSILVLYLTSMFFKAFEGSGGIYGYHAFLFGFLSILINPIAFMSWLANLTFIYCFYQALRGKQRLVLSGITALLALLSVLVTDLPIHMGSSVSAVEVGNGFYLWVISIVGLFIINVVEKNS